jgi:Uma2 family endonuclease
MAISLRLVAPPTDDDMRELAASNPGYQFERTARGELVVTPLSARTGSYEADLIGQLHHWAKAGGGGVVFSSSTGFRLPDGSLLVPDASWVRQERWDALTPEQEDGFGPFCPDAVFEILSPSDMWAYLQRKGQDYLANGARLVVLIDPKRKTVEVHRPEGSPETFEGIRPISLGPVLPGLVLDLESLFA